MEITVNVIGLDNLANAIFALAKAAGNCKEETQVDATKVTPVVQQTVAPAETAAPTTTTVPSTPPVQNVQPVPTTQTAQATPVAQNTAPAASPVPTATAPPYIYNGTVSSRSDRSDRCRKDAGCPEYAGIFRRTDIDGSATGEVWGVCICDQSD